MVALPLADKKMEERFTFSSSRPFHFSSGAFDSPLASDGSLRP
jgi:hypothetical protein